LVSHTNEEQKLRVLENRVLRRIFGSKTEEVTREWRKSRKRKLHIIYILHLTLLG